MDKNTVVIAIDHGWSNMKTVHETFTSGKRAIKGQGQQGRG